MLVALEGQKQRTESTCYSNDNMNAIVVSHFRTTTTEAIDVFTTGRLACYCFTIENSSVNFRWLMLDDNNTKNFLK